MSSSEASTPITSDTSNKTQEKTNKRLTQHEKQINDLFQNTKTRCLFVWSWAVPILLAVFGVLSASYIIHSIYMYWQLDWGIRSGHIINIFKSGWLSVLFSIITALVTRSIFIKKSR